MHAWCILCTIFPPALFNCSLFLFLIPKRRGHRSVSPQSADVLQSAEPVTTSGHKSARQMHSDLVAAAAAAAAHDPKDSHSPLDSHSLPREQQLSPRRKHVTFWDAESGTEAALLGKSRLPQNSRRQHATPVIAPEFETYRPQHPECEVTGESRTAETGGMAMDRLRKQSPTPTKVWQAVEIAYSDGEKRNGHDYGDGGGGDGGQRREEMSLEGAVALSRSTVAEAARMAAVLYTVSIPNSPGHSHTSGNEVDETVGCDATFAGEMMDWTSKGQGKYISEISCGRAPSYFVFS